MNWIRKVLGKWMPTRKVTHAAIVGTLVPVLMFVDKQFDLGLGEEAIGTLGAGVATTILIWLPIIQAYFSGGSKKDVPPTVK